MLSQKQASLMSLSRRKSLRTSSGPLGLHSLIYKIGSNVPDSVLIVDWVAISPVIFEKPSIRIRI